MKTIFKLWWKTFIISYVTYGFSVNLLNLANYVTNDEIGLDEISVEPVFILGVKNIAEVIRLFKEDFRGKAI